MSMKIQKERWQWVIKHIERLIELNAPSCVFAQALVNLFIPRLVAITGCSQHFAQMMAEKMCRGLDIYSGMCCNCHKVSIAYTTNEKDEYCPKCLAEFDQYFAEMGFDDVEDVEHE